MVKNKVLLAIMDGWGERAECSHNAICSDWTPQVNALKEKYPNIKIVGTINGYEKDNKKIIDKINKSKADIIFVALGSPKQELWITENMDKLCVKVYQGVGGSFDVFSGNIKRAPKWMQNCGLEWFYRLLKEPKRIFRQIKLDKSYKMLFLP